MRFFTNKRVSTLENHRQRSVSWPNIHTFYGEFEGIIFTKPRGWFSNESVKQILQEYCDSGRFIRTSKFGVQAESGLNLLIFLGQLSLETYIIFQYVNRKLVYQLCGFIQLCILYNFQNFVYRAAQLIRQHRGAVTTIQREVRAGLSIIFWSLFKM